MTTVALGACAPDRDSAVRTGRSTPTTVARSTTTPPGATGATERPGGLWEPTAIEVRLDHYAIEPGANTAPTGRITLNASNRDAVLHDVVVVRTSLARDRLPRSGNRVDESSPSIDILARTDPLKPQSSGSFSATLGPGTYLLVCTVPHQTSVRPWWQPSPCRADSRRSSLSWTRLNSPADPGYNYNQS